MGNCATAWTFKLSLKASAKKEWTLQLLVWFLIKGKILAPEADAAYWCGAAGRGSRTAPAYIAFQSPALWLLSRDSLNYRWANVKLFRGARQTLCSTKGIASIFSQEKQTQYIRTGEWLSCLAQKTRPVLSLACLCPSWFLICKTVAMLPFGKALSAWNCSERANCFLLFTVGTLAQGNFKNKHIDAWPGKN